ncbi:MAG: DUF4038 domain-containing protein [Bacteroidetes bacterium]|nr:MAG: DUF4038 domain-containing protein [Bacteroidota bacterium]
MKAILDNRAAKGFTSVQVFATRGWGGNERDVNNNLPFNNNNPTSLVSDYWSRWRWIADEAASRGLYFILIMGEPTKNWGQPSRVAGNTTDAYSYGRQVAEFFRTSPNIIFSMGYDDNADQLTDRKRACAEGVADGVNSVNNFDGNANYSNNTMTYHGYAVSLTLHFDSWCDFYGTEVFHNTAGVYGQVNGDYNLGVPIKPSFLMEGWYEAESGQTPTSVRNEAWFSFLGAVCGYGYGHYGNWSQVGNLSFLDATGAFGMGELVKFANRYNWWNWQPNNGLGKLVVKSSNGTEIVVYYSNNSTATINNTLSAGTTATWVDPRNVGNTASGGTFSAGQSRSMTPPSGWEDAILVLSTGG